MAFCVYNKNDTCLIQFPIAFNGPSCSGYKHAHACNTPEQ